MSDTKAENEFITKTEFEMFTKNLFDDETFVPVNALYLVNECFRRKDKGKKYRLLPDTSKGSTWHLYPTELTLTYDEIDYLAQVMTCLKKKLTSTDEKECHLSRLPLVDRETLQKLASVLFGFILEKNKELFLSFH